MTVSQQETPMTPAGLLRSLAAVATALTGTVPSALTLRARVQASRNPRAYGGARFVLLVDPNAPSTTLEARIPERLAAGLAWGHEHVLSGVLTFVERAGVLRPDYAIDTVLSTAAAAGTAETEWLEAARPYLERPKRDVDDALWRAECPRVLLVAGQGALVVDDVVQRLGGCGGLMVVEELRVNIEDPSQVAKVLRESHEEIDVIAVIRGGGERHRLTVLDDLDVFQAIASAATPVVVAIGHAADRLLIERVADRAFTTPTAFGDYLAQYCQRRREQRDQAQAAKTIQDYAELRAQLATATAELNAARRTGRAERLRWVLLGAAGAAATVAALGVLWKLI